MPTDERPRDAGETPRDPLRIAAWAVSAFLATVGLFFGIYSGQPWPSKDIVTQLARDVVRLDRMDELVGAEARANALAVQALRYDLERLREHVGWLEAETERLKAYVYPQPSGRSRRAPPAQ